MPQELGEKLKSRDNFHRQYSVLWNLMMSLESNVVTSKEAEFLYPFDMSKKEDVLTIFDAFVKEYFLKLEEEKQHQVLKVIEDVLQAGDKIVEYFFEYEFGFASKEPKNKVAFLKLVKDILVSYLTFSD
ncbi:hypothetical protein QM941_04960 [Streptococcus timonensis]|uniref:hypothetical protein n=2 Tax=Streptococcus timonensis TaxID=1852387 RepID=UPI0039C16316